MQATTDWSKTVRVEVRGDDVVGHAGNVIPRMLADNLGLTSGLSAALSRPEVLHDRGAVLRDVAVSIAGGAQQLLVRVDAHRPAVRGAGATPPQRAVRAQRAEGHRPFRAHRPGVPGRAGDRAGRLIDGEIVEGEPAGHGRTQRLGLDRRLVTGVRWAARAAPVPYAESPYTRRPASFSPAAALASAESVPAAVRSPPDRSARGSSAGATSPPVSGCAVWVSGRWKRSRAIICCPTTGSLPASPAALVNSASVTNQPGLRLGADMPAEPVFTVGLRLAGVPGRGIDGGDHPIRRHPPRDAPPPVGAIGALGGLHVLAGHQRQQPQRVRRRPLPMRCVLGAQLGQHRQRVVDQIRHQSRLGLRVAPVDVRLPQPRVVQPRDRLALMRPGLFRGQPPRTQIRWGAGPVDLGGVQITKKENTRLLLLGLYRALGGLPRSGRSSRSVGETRTWAARLRQEGVHVVLGDSVGGVIGLGLDRPQVSVTVLGDQVDTGVSAPPARPVLPQPHAAQLVRVDRVMRQEPLADALKLPAPPTWVGVTPTQQITERRHDK